MSSVDCKPDSFYKACVALFGGLRTFISMTDAVAYMTVAHAADILDIPVDGVCWLQESGKLGRSDFDGERLVPKAEVAARKARTDDAMALHKEILAASEPTVDELQKVAARFTGLSRKLAGLPDLEVGVV